MRAKRTVLKVGLAVIRNGKLLLVRKRGLEHLILPGGKPEAGESEIEVLHREIREELGCGVREQAFEGCFSDVAAGNHGLLVTVMLYLGELVGDPVPKSEIRQLEWINLFSPVRTQVAPSLLNGILPHLRSLSGRSGLGHPVASELVEGGFELT
jgi:8-oxo-dGTP diphosphatase